MRTIKESRQVDYETLHNDIVSTSEPVVMRSLVGAWPAVRQCGASGAATCQYLQQLDNGAAVYTIAAPPDAGGRFFYSDDLRGVNFRRGQIPLTQVLTQLQSQQDASTAHAIAVQSLSVRDVLPDFETENPMQLVDPSVMPTMWIGTAGKVAPHYDVHRNIACVVAGRRRFTLFPPEQIANLYLGPILNAPGGVPMSLVDLWNPDFDQFPRFAEALDVAQEATLEPGDAIYIPSLWWHAVESLDSVNVLVNYWWGGIPENRPSPNDSLLHAMLTIAELDDAQRQAWRDYFEYFVFRPDQKLGDHLPSDIADIVTRPSTEQIASIRKFLSAHLEEDA